MLMLLMIINYQYLKYLLMLIIFVYQYCFFLYIIFVSIISNIMIAIMLSIILTVSTYLHNKTFLIYSLSILNMIIIYIF